LRALVACRAGECWISAGSGGSPPAAKIGVSHMTIYRELKRSGVTGRSRAVE
jgi:hypothetical protein